MAILYRENKGSKLTAEEVDNNFKWLAEAGVSNSNTIFLNRPSWIHGDWNNPITGPLAINVTGAVNAGCAAVIWSGSSNPVITGAVVAERTGNITVQGTYIIYIWYVHGRVCINTPSAEDGGTTPGTLPAAPTNLVLTQSELVVGTIPAAPTNLILTEGVISTTPAAPTNLVLTEGTI